MSATAVHAQTLKLAVTEPATLAKERLRLRRGFVSDKEEESYEGQNAGSTSHDDLRM